MIPSGAGGGYWSTQWNTRLPVDAAALQAAIQCDAAYQTWTSGLDDRPMNCIDWYVAFAFCAWDGGRLPSEAEWNYAATGGADQRKYPWGGTVLQANTAWAIYNCLHLSSGTCVDVRNIGLVGIPPNGFGKYGHADLAGNLFEWVMDSYAATYRMPCTNCVNSTGTRKVVRGGAYDNDEYYLRASARFTADPVVPSRTVGARCVRLP